MNSPEVVSDWRRFAEITIQTNDLDPMYPVFKGYMDSGKPLNWMGRFILTFLMFYNAGAAIGAANSTNDKTYWDYIKKIYPSVPRGTERRHFRGVNGLRAISIMSTYRPIDILDHWYFSCYSDMERCIRMEWRGVQMGPYFIWKLFDIFNMIGWDMSLSVEEAVRYMPEEPRKAAALFFPHLPFKDSLMYVKSEIEDFYHPVLEGRCGYAEAETILCMMKGFFHTKAHRIGDDIEDKWKQLKGYPEAQSFLPQRINMDLYQAGEPSWLSTAKESTNPAA